MRRVPLAAAALVFIVHLAANPHYGFFRDELYFIVCGRHPQWGYVDQPPVVPLLAALTQIGGHSLVLLRAVPALFAAGGVYVTCELAAAFSGGLFAQGIAALVFLGTPVLLSFGMKVGTDEVGLFTWPLITLLVVRLTQGADARLWLAVGAVAGVTFESKYSVVFFLIALGIGLLATPERRAMRTWFFGGGAAVALAIALPNIGWQLRYGLPMLELLRNGQNGKNVIVSPLAYVGQELLITNLFVAFVWIVGLVWLARRPRLRFVAIAYIALIGEMLVFHGKHYYPADFYPAAIAAGGVALEGWSARRRWVRVLGPAYIAAACLITVPDALPVLPVRAYLSFAAARNALLHVSPKLLATERGREDGELPGDWADMHGWPEMAARVAAAYEALPPNQRREAVVFAGNYGEASAVAFFAPDVPVISEHNQFWLWGPRGASGKILVQINGSCFAADRFYGSRRLVTTLDDPYADGDERNAPIWICRNPKSSLAALWPAIKVFE